MNVTRVRREHLAGLLATVLLFGLGCGDDGGEPYEMQVDTFNVALAGAFIPYEAERRQPIIDALAASDSDVVCLQEVWRQEDKDLIEAGVAGTFPHAVSFTHGLDTPVDDPTDQEGMVPPTPTAPPCADATLASQFEAAVACLEENCNSEPGSDAGQTTSSACAQSECLDVVTPLILGDDAALACYSCLTTSLPTEPFADMRDLCTNEVGAELAFRGQSGVMILSRHPLRDAEAFVMPGTWNRRIVASATAELPNGSEVDVHCNHLTPIFDSIAFPYTGDYGDEMDGPDGWAAEQLLQAGKLVDWVGERSATRPAVILGDMNAGRAGDGLTAEGVATMDVLEGAFTLAVASDFTPSCTFCPDNPNASEGSPAVWIDHIFVANVEAEDVLSTEVVYDESTVSADGMMVPLSDHFALRSVIAID
ncbi:MAG TPA: endonuclease/exonuclease/phosphatase family protein [Polyangiaceae bacterium LLY-WYZ-15_(1-7)]|nr:hypothetical protein [Myxococcales bacterium]MAT24454.1 hypothetical protein [Sandaracinus sp.]HJK90033.1 endonuclease/exonuclease/phosphatase family protein [Polyangiaceae bacterium LLY-WYZ-15_(1-7)]MBJ70829.1 hypothetical protein [Sandaracinus sp.]HJL00797.1 endonuclease/exonuclease/phosphatase family protein [Polyangiaceae bacterium LLY-WYZ-15_(1-7)]